jgi:signal transduction histidine kinase
VKREAEDLKVSLNFSADSTLPFVDGDLGQLAAALECVLRNAIEASSEGHEVTVRAQAGPDSILSLIITDAGSGISQEQRAHIFEPFYSGRNAGRGLGMGLPKAWRIVRNHGGEIVVANNDPGTVVRLNLPVSPAAAEPDRVCA